MQRVAIVDPNEPTRESLRTLLLGVDNVWLDNECARYEYFADVIQSAVPDLAIVALDADKNKALQLIGQLAVEHPTLPILTISHDHQALLQSLQKGAKFFLTHPVGLQDMLDALRRVFQGSTIIDPAAPGVPARQAGMSSIVAVMGSRGGVGTTTLAVNLAATLAADPANQAALIDLDLALGDADIALEVSGVETISIADLAANIERLDMNFLRRAMAKHEASNLSILRHPLEIAQVGVIHEQHVERIINLLKLSYTHLVLDLSKGLLPTDLMALRLADQILLVCQLELASLRNVVRIMHTLAMEEDLADKVRVVVNRQGADSLEEGISLKKAEEVIGKPIFWQLPNDHKPVIAARVAGHPLIKHAPKCKIQQSITGLAQALYGKPAEGRGGSKGWFSRR
jgi:pilus assembly protein CpaE